MANETTMPTANEVGEKESGGKKITLHAEFIWLLSLVLLGFAVAMVGTASFGYSSVVAPSYVFSEGVGFLTFGQSEYVVQGLLFIALCLIVRRVRLVYFSAFGTCLLYGLVLDLWRRFVPLFNPEITVPGSMHIAVRILLFVGGVTLTMFAVALTFHTYLLPQVNDFFVKEVTTVKGYNLTKFKTIYDVTSLLVALILSLVFFGTPIGHGIGVGTVVIALVGGTLIGAFDKLLTKTVRVKALFPKLEAFFNK